MHQNQFLKLVCIFFFVFTWKAGLAQCPGIDAFAKQVTTTEKIKLPYPVKLQKLYELKKLAQNCHLTKDSVYVSLLIKIGIYEYWANTNYAEAIQNTQEALGVNQALGVKTAKALTLNAYIYLAYYYLAVNFYSQSLAYNDSVIISGANFPDTYLMARKNRVIIYALLEDQQKASEESSLGINEARKYNNSQHLLFFLNSKAKAECFLGELPRAKTDVYHLLKLAQQDQQQNEQAEGIKTLAFIYDSEKKYDSAIYFFKQAVQFRVADKTINVANKVEALTGDYLDMGNFYLTSVHNYANATNSFLRAMVYQKQLKNPLAQSYNEAQINIGLGKSCVETNRLQQAVQFYSQALRAVNIQTADFINHNPSSKQFDTITYKDVAFQVMQEKVTLLLALFHQNKNAAYINNALTTCLLIDSIITQIRHGQTGELSKLNWRDMTRDFFSDAIQCCYLAHDTEKAFFFMEKSRAVLLADELNERSANKYLPAQDQKKIDTLQFRIIQLQQLLSASAVQSQYDSIENVLTETRVNLDNFMGYLEKKYHHYTVNKYNNEMVSFASLQNYVKKNNQSFIYYFRSDSAIYALSISKDRTNFLKILNEDFDQKKLSAFISLCSDKEAINNDYKAFALLAQNIYNNLIKPLQLTSNNVVICTDNFFIPFEALCTDNKGSDLLIYHYNFSYVYSALSLLKSYDYNKAIGNFAGFAPVTFTSGLGVFPLLNSATALDQVADLYSNNTLFTEHQSTKRNFFSQAANYSVVTIFSHAQADTTGAEPVLYMQDSLVHLSELQMLKNPAIQFVLLSACQTNIGKSATGEGIYSLARGFAAAGVPAVSATLWKADEESVYRISELFNQYLVKGMNKSEALQKAKIDYLQSSDHEHTLPYYWANMVLIGSSQPLVLISSSYCWYWLSAAIIVVIAASVYFIYKKRNKRRQVTAANFYKAKKHPAK